MGQTTLRLLLCGTLAGMFGGAPAVHADDDIKPRLDAALAGDHRDAGNAPRDRYRHPVETLTFFGLEPGMTVVELGPGRGWYTELLAPALKGSGKLIVTTYRPDVTDDYEIRSRDALQKKLAARPDIYGEVVTVPFAPPAEVCLGQSGSADLVVTFRNLHNWLEAQALDEVLQGAYAVLKPGGTLGVVEHRGTAGMTEAQMAKTGYLPEDYVIGQARKAGFALAGRSEVNANAKDTKDYAEGVWTLPPALRLGDTDRERYLAIGESDRMTLKFVRPKDGPAPAAVCPAG